MRWWVGALFGAACLRWDLYARPVSDALRLELQAARAHLEADRALSAARGTGFLGHRHGSAAWHAHVGVEKGQPRCCRRWAVRTPRRRERWVFRAPLSRAQAAVLGAHPVLGRRRESERVVYISKKSSGKAWGETLRTRRRRYSTTSEAHFPQLKNPISTRQTRPQDLSVKWSGAHGPSCTSRARLRADA